jgi:HEPN domain-containing protein
MSSEEQADAYLEEAELTLKSAAVIYTSAEETGRDLWAQVVKNGYDAIEQAVSAGIAEENEAIPRNHPGKINTFIELNQPPEPIEDILLHWLQRRSSSQYVDIRGDEINIPHEQFDRDDAQQILEDTETVIQHVKNKPD